MPEDPIEREVRNLVTLNRQTNEIRRLARQLLRVLVVPEVAATLARHDPASVAARYQAGRVAKVLAELEAVAGTGYSQIRRMMIDELATLGSMQARWAADLLDHATDGLATASRVVGKGRVREILHNEHMSGLTLREWIDASEASFVRGATQAVRSGTTSGLSADGIRRTLAPVYRTARGNLDAVARTAVTFTTSRAHLATYEANDDVLEGVEFVATLDSRTTVICARWDGTVWPTDSPRIQVPPLHFNCRSNLAPVVDWEGLGIQPPKKGTRASEDGPTSARTYETWFRRQDAAKQNSIIGPTRARMYRRGDISFRDMVTRDNRVRPISDLT